ncbi:hypothetical protein M422DRAFT_241495 [Sphaerobolus stellatus SS14]|nr:hypothetical protein M422DRAFT_241495 [Sphaerobolus stellatus SS14]
MFNFYESELSSALSEVKFGISTFRVDEDSTTAHTAVAVVDLLEGRQIRIGLSGRGYQLLEGDNGTVFEVLEGLLGSVSPLFLERQGAELSARLFQVTDQFHHDAEDQA